MVWPDGSVQVPAPDGIHERSEAIKVRVSSDSKIKRDMTRFAECKRREAFGRIRGLRKKQAA